jgi:hypothetical protein
MGCLISILCFIFFPVIYFWYQFRRARKGLDEVIRNQMNRQQGGDSTGYSSADGPSDGSSTAETASPGTNGIRKPHIFKPGEGEYVDYKEIDD